MDKSNIIIKKRNIIPFSFNQEENILEYSYLHPYIDSEYVPEQIKDDIKNRFFNLHLDNLPITWCKDKYRGQLPDADQYQEYPRSLRIPLKNNLFMISRAMGPNMMDYILSDPQHDIVRISFSLSNESHSRGTIEMKYSKYDRLSRIFIVRLFSVEDPQDEFQKMIKEWDIRNK